MAEHRQKDKSAEKTAQKTGEKASQKAGGHQPFLSMWALLGKCSFYKILAILLTMVFAEGVLFHLAMENILLAEERLSSGDVLYSEKTEPEVSDYDSDSDAYVADYQYDDAAGCATLYQLFKDSGIERGFLVALGAVFVCLGWTEGRLDDKSAAVMLRLRVTQKEFYVIKTFYNMFCLTLLITVQIWTIFGMLWRFRTEMGLDQAAKQLLFLAFYGIRFLHCLLPMAEAGKWLRNILLVVAFSMEAAGVKKKKVMMPIILFILSAGWFVSDMGVNALDIICCAVFACVILKGIGYYHIRLSNPVTE